MKTQLYRLATACTFALIALIGCQRASDPGSLPVKKINLGKQVAAIQLTAGNNNDLNIAPSGNTTTMIRLLANSSGSTLTGISVGAMSDGDLFLLRNDAASGAITITNADTNSLAANRITTQNGLSLVIPPRGAMWLEYDGTAGLVASPGLSIGDTAIGATGHLRSTGTAPTLTSCGTSPTIAGGDLAGVVTTGSGATTCTITFSRTFTSAPSCYFLPTGTATMPVYTVSATAITVTTDIASTTYSYGCIGQ